MGQWYNLPFSASLLEFLTRVVVRKDKAAGHLASCLRPAWIIKQSYKNLATKWLVERLILLNSLSYHALYNITCHLLVFCMSINLRFKCENVFPLRHFIQIYKWTELEIASKTGCIMYHCFKKLMNQLSTDDAKYNTCTKPWALKCIAPSQLLITLISLTDIHWSCHFLFPHFYFCSVGHRNMLSSTLGILAKIVISLLF